jgi:flagellar biosynthesis protein FlhG
MSPESRAASHPANGPSGRRFVTVASGKGGVGKTFFAISLAHALARAGRRVLLFDADLGLANVDIQLGLNAEADLGQVIAGRCPLKAAVASYADGGYHVVPGKSGSGALAELDSGHLKALVAELLEVARAYDLVIMDHSAGIDATTRLLSPPGGIDVVVVTDEPTSLTDAYAYIKVALQQRRPRDIRVVVNMATDRRHGERTYGALARACESFLKVKPQLAGVIRRDRRVADSIRHQTGLLVRYPTSPAAADVEAAAQQLLATLR